MLSGLWRSWRSSGASSPTQAPASTSTSTPPSRAKARPADEHASQHRTTTDAAPREAGQSDARGSAGHRSSVESGMKSATKAKTASWSNASPFNTSRSTAHADQRQTTSSSIAQGPIVTRSSRDNDVDADSSSDSGSDSGGGVLTAASIRTMRPEHFRLNQSSPVKKVLVKPIGPLKYKHISEPDTVSGKSRKRPRPPRSPSPELSLPPPRSARKLVASAEVPSPQLDDVAAHKSGTKKARNLTDPPLKEQEKQNQNQNASLSRIQPSSSSWPEEASYTSLDDLLNYPDPDKRPHYTWWVMIRAAILGAPGQKATTRQLAEMIANKYPYYAKLHAEGKLVKSIPSTMATKACFYSEKSEGATFHRVDTTINPMAMAIPKRDKGNALSASVSGQPANSSAPKAPLPNKVVPVQPQRDLRKEAIDKLLADPPKLAPLPPASHSLYATSLDHLLASSGHDGQLKHLEMVMNGQIASALRVPGSVNPVAVEMQEGPHQMITLVRAAIIGSPHRRLKVDQIVKEITDRFPTMVEAGKENNFRSAVHRTLQAYKCFFKAMDGNNSASTTWMVDLEVHPKNVRSRTAKMGRKEATEFRKAHAEALKKLADPASTTLQNLVQECLAHSSYYQKATDRTVKRRELLAMSALGPWQKLPDPPQPPPPRPLIDTAPVDTASVAIVKDPSDEKQNREESPELPPPPPSVRKPPPAKKVQPPASAAPKYVLSSSMIAQGSNRSSPESLDYDGPSAPSSVRTSSHDRSADEGSTDFPGRITSSSLLLLDSASSKGVARTSSQSATPRPKKRPPSVILIDDEDDKNEVNNDDEDGAEIGGDAIPSRPGSKHKTMSSASPQQTLKKGAADLALKQQQQPQPPPPSPTVYVCGHHDFKTGSMCEARFLNNVERVRHLRYEHGKIEDRFASGRNIQISAEAQADALQKLARRDKTNSNKKRKLLNGGGKRAV